MGSDKVAMFWQAKRARDDQLIYYTQSLAVAGLAFVFTQTGSEDLYIWEVWAAVALLFAFGIVTLAGFSAINCIRKALGMELEVAQWEASTSPEQRASGRHSSDMAEAAAKIHGLAEKARTSFAVHYWGLFASCLGLAGWRVARMTLFYF